MILDVHCHVGYSARRVDATIPRFSFESQGAAATPGYDSYLSPRLLARPAWWFVKRWMGIDPRLPPGEALDRCIEEVNERHWSQAVSADRLVLLAFDEYHDAAGRARGMASRGARFGSDLYASNTLVRAMRDARPDRFLFGASLHPYRTHEGRDAVSLLEELAAARPALVKWLPIHQNIDIKAPRCVAFLRAAARLRIPMLIHYGGEMSLSRQHMEYESPLPLLGVLRALRAEGAMPTVIVAHVATPSFFWQRAAGCRTFVEAMLGEFADAPLYADISALAAFGRTHWLRTFARRRELHRKLVWGSDYPIPVLLRPFRRELDRATRARIAAMPSWIEQDLQLKRALGFDEAVFTRADELLPGR